MKKASVLFVIAVGLCATVAVPTTGARTNPCKRYSEKTGCALLSGTYYLYQARGPAPSRLRPASIAVTTAGPRSGAKSTSASLVENFTVPCSYLGTYNGHFPLKGTLKFGSTLKVNASFTARHTTGTMHVAGTAKLTATTAVLRLRQTFIQAGKTTCDQRVNVTARRAKQF